MIFSMPNFLYSLLLFIYSFLFILVGIVLMLLPFSLAIRESLIFFIQNHWSITFLFGFVIFTVGLATIFGIIFSKVPKYFTIHKHLGLVEIDELVIQKYLDRYWKTLFPETDIAQTIEFKKNGLNVYVDLPTVALEDQKNLIERIDQEISQLLFDNLGFRGDLDLNLKFQDTPVIK
ncbi:MAG: hypothetical protein BGO10_01585 [Chlamydia sp. 32-24]|nr:MAG: hypothetical protein BGO10_01585 [Chlamydia sp. 32-24]